MRKESCAVKQFVKALLLLLVVNVSVQEPLALTYEAIPQHHTSNTKPQLETFTIPSIVTLEELEKEYLQFVLRHSNNNHSDAAKRLKISRSTLWRKLK